MNCCIAHAKPKGQPSSRQPRSGWRSLSGCAGSGALLVLLPKCPLCLAAYLAVFTGAGAAMPIATRVRPLLEIVLVASPSLLLLRFVKARRRKTQLGGARRDETGPDD